MAKGLLDNVREIFEQKNGADKAWKWAMAPDGAHSKAKRFGALAHYAGNQRDNSHGDERDRWADRRRVYAEHRDEFERRYEARKDQLDWPGSMRFAELLYHYPGPHVHAASYERDKLIAVGKIGEKKFDLRIAEFPPWEAVEPVHVSGSMHYRLPNGTVLPTSSPLLRAGGAGGCAFDANDQDGGSDEEYAFYLELRRRYT